MEYYKCSVCGAIHPIKKYYSFDGYQGEKPEYVYCCLNCNYKITAPNQATIREIVELLK